MFGFQINIRGRTANWIGSIVFILLGSLIAFYLPTMVQPNADRNSLLLILRNFGGVFAGLGLLTLVWMLGDLYFKYKSPEYRQVWYWWGNFLIATLLPVGIFAVPASLAFPILFLAYLFAPNALFPAGSPDVANNLIVGLIFSVVGMLALAGMFFVARSMYRNRPRSARRVNRSATSSQ
jgi:hypothetical protein